MGVKEFKDIIFFASFINFFRPVILSLLKLPTNMYDPLFELILRQLDESNSTEAPPDNEDDPTGGNSTDTGGDDTADNGTQTSPLDQLMAYQKWGYVILAVVILFCFCFTWRCCKRRRDRRNLELDSARADNVLGDMAMVPTHDTDDEDAELI